MTPALPRQHRRCSVYPSCTGHASASDAEHHGRAEIVSLQGGRELRFALTASSRGPVRVSVEVVLEPGEPPLEVAELDPAEVVRAAAVLRRLAVESQDRVSDSS